jgi:hypothetical protein
MSFESGVSNSFLTRGPPSGEIQLLGSVVWERRTPSRHGQSKKRAQQCSISRWSNSVARQRTVCLRTRSSCKLRPVTSASASRSPNVSCTSHADGNLAGCTAKRRLQHCPARARGEGPGRRLESSDRERQRQRQTRQRHTDRDRQMQRNRGYAYRETECGARWERHAGCAPLRPERPSAGRSLRPRRPFCPQRATEAVARVTRPASARPHPRQHPVAPT